MKAMRIRRSREMTIKVRKEKKGIRRKSVTKKGGRKTFDIMANPCLFIVTGLAPQKTIKPLVSGALCQTDLWSLCAVGL
jgi:hypothetical protein